MTDLAAPTTLAPLNLPVDKPQDSNKKCTDESIKQEEISDANSDDTNESEEVSTSLRPNLRNRELLAKPDRYGYHSEKLPHSIEEALTIPEWKESTLKEFKSINNQDVWEEVDKKLVTNPLKTVAVFKVKDNMHAKAPIYKTRLCVQGFNQRYGID